MHRRWRDDAAAAALNIVLSPYCFFNLLLFLLLLLLELTQSLLKFLPVNSNISFRHEELLTWFPVLVSNDDKTLANLCKNHRKEKSSNFRLPSDSGWNIRPRCEMYVMYFQYLNIIIWVCIHCTNVGSHLERGIISHIHHRLGLL